MYFMRDQQEQTQYHYTTILGTHAAVILVTIFHECIKNYVHTFKTELDFDSMPTDTCKLIMEADTRSAEDHKQCFNTSIINIMVVVISGNEFNLRNKVLQKKDNRLQGVCETNRAIDALQRPLMFWKGDDGYNFEVT